MAQSPEVSKLGFILRYKLFMLQKEMLMLELNGFPAKEDFFSQKRAFGPNKFGKFDFKIVAIVYLHIKDSEKF